MTTQPEAAPPALFGHCLTVFGQMRSEAASVRLADGGEDRHALVYEGFSTKMFQALGLPTPYYTHVMRRLQAMSCIRQLSRGGGGSPSRWELIEDPSIDKFMDADVEEKKQPNRQEMTELNVVHLTRRMNHLEELVEGMVEAYRDRPTPGLEAI